MNAKRRKEIGQIAFKLKAAMMDLDIIRNEEEEARENMPESLQESERYLASEEASETLDELYDQLEEAYDGLMELSEGK